LSNETSIKRNGNFTVFSVPLSEASLTLTVLSVFTGLLQPYPAEINQLENQLVLLKESHYFYSPYTTEVQKTNVKLASSAIESFTKLSPSAARGATITFGPYKDIESYQVFYFYYLLYINIFLLIHRNPLIIENTYCKHLK
jgi:hypothetical protein